MTLPIFPNAEQAIKHAKEVADQSVQQVHDDLVKNNALLLSLYDDENN